MNENKQNEKDNIIELFFFSSYKDGGSESYRDKDGNEYWKDKSIGSRSTSNYGKLYVGNINDKNRVLAKGNFKLIKKVTKYYGGFRSLTKRPYRKSINSVKEITELTQ